MLSATEINFPAMAGYLQNHSILSFHHRVLQKSNNEKNKMKRSHPILTVTSVLLFLCSFQVASAKTSPKASGEPNPVATMIERWFPGRSADFILEQQATGKQRDFFGIQSVKNKIKITGNTPLAIASGFGYYLKTWCHVNISIQGEDVQLPSVLPTVKEKIVKRTPFEKRYFFNYCTFGYTMAWWDWNRWEKIIDWMAMKGINMPLAVTGQEAVWQKLLKEFHFTDEEIRKYLAGPAFLPWEWMGNIDGLAGPLPENWIRSHEVLERKILARERAYGMTPVLQGFTGHVPSSMKDKYPGIRMVQTTDWAGMPGTYILDPRDPMFDQLGRRFIEIQTELYGTDHLYDADCFNEVNPPSKDTAFIGNVSKSVFHSMTSADPDAVWVMQGWFLYWQKDFWKEPQARALLGAVPADRLLLLDLYGEKYPVWNETKSFYGKPWIWNIICNLGQKVNLSGDLSQIYKNYTKATTSPDRGALKGIGMMMEGFGYNPVVQEFLTSLIWTPRIESLPRWISDFATQRYGRYNQQATEAWKDLLHSVYSHTASDESPICYMPGSSFPETSSKNPYGAEYDSRGLFNAVRSLLAASDSLKSNANYQFDLVHTVREMLSLKANLLLAEIRKAELSKNLTLYKEKSAAFLTLLTDMDRILATNKHFLLGIWIRDAKKWGMTGEEKKYYEWNARSIITLWQPSPQSQLSDYASKQWSGLVSDYYGYRWKKYFEMVSSGLENGTAFDAKKYHQDMKQWEYNWIQQDNLYTDKPQGDPVAIARELYDTYSRTILPGGEDKK
jgi:alpha-N-acetylglucosaminidase